MRRRRSRTELNLVAYIITIGLAGFFGGHVAFAAPQSGAPKLSTDTTPTPTPTVTLRLKDTSVFNPVAPNAIKAGTKCDSSGNVFLQFAYFDPTRGRVDSDPGISEVIPESKRIVVYAQSPLSSDDYPNANLRTFNVTPTGTLYALISSRRDAPEEGPRPAPEYYIERFKDDGTTDSMTHISAPPGSAHWMADLFGAFRDGSFLIAGTVSRNGDLDHPNANSWQPFTAIYDPSGRFVRELTLPDDVVNDYNQTDGPAPGKSKTDGVAPTAAGAPPLQGAGESRPAAQTNANPPTKSREFFDVSISTGALISAPDGNVWILRASDPLRLYAINLAGEIVKHFQFSPPVPGLKPFQLGFAGPQQIFFKFVHFSGGSGGRSDLLGVFNTVSERFESLYALPDTEKGFRALACSDGRGGFLYLGGTSDDHLAVYDYVPQ